MNDNIHKYILYFNYHMYIRIICALVKISIHLYVYQWKLQYSMKEKSDVKNLKLRKAKMLDERKI